MNDLIWGSAIAGSRLVSKKRVFKINPPLVSAIDRGLHDPEMREEMSDVERCLFQYAAGNDVHFLDQITDVYDEVCLVIHPIGIWTDVLSGRSML